MTRTLILLACLLAAGCADRSATNAPLAPTHRRPLAEAAEVVPAIGALRVQLAALRGGLDEQRGAPDYNHTIGVLA